MDPWALTLQEPNLNPLTFGAQQVYAQHITDRVRKLFGDPETRPAVDFVRQLIEHDLEITLRIVHDALTNFQRCAPGTEFNLGFFISENRRWVAGFEQMKFLLLEGPEQYLRAYDTNALVFLGKA